ncbi:MAG: NADH-quinone oxidoreductase subunit N [Peptococcaceae bacterium]|jgi:NADH-quinone oxidoreductase subunit N|nr:NADH-quinone oxidoreductase subunit N [Peptococcaceae bacterium]MDH7525696.1 NADH-quinone oxidoreductase subunit N [Peptococcaceae bacterium]
MEFRLVYPELLTTALAFGVLVLSILVPRERRIALNYASVLGLAAVLAVLVGMLGVNDSLLDGMYVVDGFATYFKILVVISAIMVSLISPGYTGKFMPDSTSEYNSVLLFAVLGMMLLVSAGDLITLYTSLELMTISFIALVGFGTFLRKAPEAAVKYILLSALSSALLLYGLTLVFGLSGSTLFTDIALYVKTKHVLEPLMLMGLVFILAGFAFKVSAVPFHMWTPDVYDGAPTTITAFLSVASKGAGFAVLLRLFMRVFTDTQVWMPVVVVIAALSILLGNYVAIPQTNIKRLMAYSGIAQAGYILLGLVAYTRAGLESAIFYAMLYVFCNLGAFAVITVMGEALESDEIEDYAGLWKRSPLMAATMLICLLSLAGIPPLAGFYGKFYLFTAAMEQGYLWLVIVALGMSMVSVYYYLMVAKVMYYFDPKEDQPIPVPLAARIVMVAAVLITIFIGVYPDPLTDVAVTVAKTFLP